MVGPERSYVIYVDDSGNQDAGILWSALAIPLDLWTEYLGRWLGFRQALAHQHDVPSTFELHAQEWLSQRPTKRLEGEQAELARKSDGEVLPILERQKAARRLRFEVYEKGLRTIGTFAEAQVLTVYKPGRKGKTGLYSELLCFVEEFLKREKAYAVVMVDGGHDSGAQLHGCHRSLPIKTRRVIEDAGLRRSHESHLLQMVDWCAYSAFQSLQDRPNLATPFKEAYEREFDALIVRPFTVTRGPCIRGADWDPNVVPF